MFLLLGFCLDSVLMCFFLTNDLTVLLHIMVRLYLVFQYICSKQVSFNATMENVNLINQWIFFLQLQID